MNLYIMRHANAGVRRDNPLLDVKRGLIKEGKQQCMQMATVLTGLKAQIDVILSSPLKRSLQSAQLVATEIGFEQPILIAPALAPEGTYADFQQLLLPYTDREGVLVVGHNPNLYQFLARILSGNGAPAGGGTIRMRKGTIARVDMGRRPAQLQWLIDPRLIRVAQTNVTKSSRPKTSRK